MSLLWRTACRRHERVERTPLSLSKVNHFIPKKATAVSETSTIISEVSRLFLINSYTFVVFQPAVSLFKCRCQLRCHHIPKPTHTSRLGWSFLTFSYPDTNGLPTVSRTLFILTLDYSNKLNQLVLLEAGFCLFIPVDFGLKHSVNGDILSWGGGAVSAVVTGCRYRCNWSDAIGCLECPK